MPGGMRFQLLLQFESGPVTDLNTFKKHVDRLLHCIPRAWNRLPRPGSHAFHGFRPINDSFWIILQEYYSAVSRCGSQPNTAFVPSAAIMPTQVRLAHNFCVYVCSIQSAFSDHYTGHGRCSRHGRRNHANKRNDRGHDDPTRQSQVLHGEMAGEGKENASIISQQDQQAEGRFEN